MLRRAWLFSVLTFLTGLIGTSSASEVDRSPSPAKTLRIGITVTNPSSQPIRGGTLKVFGPLAEHASPFRVRTLVNESFREEIDPLGNRAVLFSPIAVPAYATRRFVITFELTPSGDGVRKTPTGKQFLLPEPFIESDASEIVRQSQLLLGSGAPDQFPKRAYDWVAQHIHYSGFVADDRGALYGLRAAQGDCTEYATLFVALMRAAGIPARVVGGWVLGASGLVRASEYHNWAEYFAEDKWHLVDPQRRVFQQESADYVATRIVARSSSDSVFSYRYELFPAPLQAEWD